MAAVFVYGTLMPGHLRWPVVERYVASRRPAVVTGRLYDTGLGYPAARFDEPGRVEGWLLALRPGEGEAARRTLDRVEGPQYAAVTVRTTRGVEALAYEWCAPAGRLVALPAGRWTGA